MAAGVAPKDPRRADVVSVFPRPPHTALAYAPNDADGAYRGMATSLLGPVLAGDGEFSRLVVDLEFARTDANTLIGRAGHVAFLERPAVAELVVASLYDVFR